MASPDDICFKGNSDLECNCTSSPPELPEKPSFYIEPSTTTTPPNGTYTETPTTTPGTSTPPGNTTVTSVTNDTPTITTTAEPSTTGPSPNTGITDQPTIETSPVTDEFSSPSDTNPTPEGGPSSSPSNNTKTVPSEGSTSNPENTTWTTSTTTTSSIGSESTTLVTTTTDLNTTQGNDTTTTTPDNGSPTTQDAVTGTASIVPSTSDMNSGSTFGGTEIITDIASTVGTTPYDDGTPPVDTSSSTTNTDIFTSDGTTFSNPTSLDPTEYTRSNGITATSSDPPLETLSRATSSNPPSETFSTGLPKGTSPINEKTPHITTTETTEVLPTTCHPNAVCANAATSSAGLIAGCVCGAVAVIVLCGILIWYLWKKKKGCFAPEGSGGKNGSKECLPDHEQNNVELMKVEKRGTVILTPVTNPTVTPGPLPPIPKSEITPVNHPSTEEASPSHSAGSKPGSATSKKKKKTSRTNRVSPEPIPGPTSPTGGGGG
ncbi:mucin-2-like isoform X5 [Lytechinus variegatus]|uniref:mucin-2-like isoform X5 n=1 Tax=Lytechinus variegatus TaxID=7654 RepID=UPI001BB13DD8|nr:mucin-2-like isoform X5 [Lytechinus variegatus]